jgi:hypothetical protein
MNDPENQNPEDYPKMRIAQMPLKKNFKVVLDANNTASYSGKQFDASFTVDLNQIIRETWRMKRAYKMTFSFRSISGLFSVNTVTSTKLYKLHIDLGKGTPTMYQYNQTRVPAGIVGVSSEGVGVYTNVAAASAFDIPCYFNARPNDNDGVFVNDLQNINTITLNLIDPTTGTFNSSDNATINTATKYICVLNFQEL